MNPTTPPVHAAPRQERILFIGQAHRCDYPAAANGEVSLALLSSCLAPFPPRTPGSGGEDLAGGETNLTIGDAPRSRREGPPPNTAAAVATTAPHCRAECHP